MCQDPCCLIIRQAKLVAMSQLVTENRDRSKGRMLRPQNDKSRGRSKSIGKDYACYHYDKQGHVKKNCQVWKREQNQGNQKKEENKDTTAPVTCNDEDVAVVVEECVHVGD